MNVFRTGTFSEWCVVSCGRDKAAGHSADSQAQTDLLRWAARQRQVQFQVVNEECERTPADRFLPVLSILQASALFPGFKQAWLADEAAVRENRPRNQRIDCTSEDKRTRKPLWKRVICDPRKFGSLGESAGKQRGSWIPAEPPSKRSDGSCPKILPKSSE